MRFAITLVTFACLSISYGRQINTVTLDESAAPLPVILKSLSEQTGFEFTVREPMDRYVLGLRLTDVSLEEAMKAIATTTVGVWERDGSMYFLAQDVTALARHRMEQQKWFREGIDLRFKEIAELVNGLPPMQSYGEIRAQREASTNVNAPTPQTSLSLRILHAAGAGAIRDIQPGERRVFSTSPNRMQKRFSGGTNGLIKTFVAETDIYERDLSVAAQTDPESLRILRSGSELRILLTVKRRDYSGSIESAIMILDNRYYTVLSSSTYVPFSFSNMPEYIPPRLLHQDLELDLPEVTLKMLRFFGNRGTSPNSTEDDLELKPMLADPVLHEPLNLFVGPILRAYARSSDYVVWIPERSLQMFASPLREGVITVNRIKSLIASLAAQIKVVDRGERLVLMPTNVVQASETLADREALRHLLKSGVTTGYFRLADLAQYSDSVSAIAGFDVVLADRIVPFLGFQLRDVYAENKVAYQAFSRLSVADQPKLNRSSVEYAPGGFGTELRKFLETTVFHGPQNPFRSALTMSSRDRVVPTRERTELLPTGLANFQGMSVTVNKLTTVRGFGGENSYGAHLGTMSELGEQNARAEMQETTSEGRVSDMRMRVSTFAISDTTRYHVRFLLSTDVIVTYQLTDFDFGKNIPLPLSQLPNDMQAEYWKSYNETKQDIATNRRVREGERQGP